MIPKIIHQTAKTKEISWEENRLIFKAKKLMPDFEFYLWDDIENEQLIKEYFPKYLDKYKSINKGVAKADIARIVYMYVFGGIYCDTDYKFFKSPSAYFEMNKDAQVILPISREYEDVYRIGNAIFASVPKQQIWIDFIDYVFKNSEINNLKENRIEKITGPEGFTDFYVENKHKYNNVCLAKKDIFHPKTTYIISMAPSESIGMHLCWGSWRTKSLIEKIKIFLNRKLTAI